MAFKRISSREIEKPINGRDTTFGIYPSYLFKEHDPIIDQVFTLIDKAGLSGKLTMVAATAHISDSTIRNWDKRKVKRPQFASIKALVNSLGGHLVIEYRGEKIGS